MKNFIGTKTISAEPMTLTEAQKVLNREIKPATKEEDGYLVEYKDGYKSWSPKSVFEEAYRPANTVVERLLIEKEDLQDKYDSLTNLLNVDFNNAVNEAGPKQVALLIAQRQFMKSYLETLKIRIADLTKEEEATKEEKVEVDVESQNVDAETDTCDCNDEVEAVEVEEVK